MKLSQILLTIALLTSLSVIKSSHAGSATWNLNPTSGDWNTATNWTPETVPEEATDVATFDVSSVTNISTTSPGVAIAQITFNPGASAYLIAGKVGFETSGVVNNSGITQNFDIAAGFSFAGTATAGSGVVYTHYGGVSSGDSTFFVDNSNAGTATFIINGYNTGFQSGGLVFFEDHSSAADSIIINEQGDFSGGQTYFNDSATAGNSMITTQTGGALVFDNHATGATATLMADGGSILFQALSTGSLAQVELISGGLLDLGRHTNSGLMTIGSLEGDNTSIVRLGTQKLTVGGNGLSTTFSGVI